MFISSLTKNSYIIWIDENVNNEENQNYVTKLKSTPTLEKNINTIIDIESGLNEIFFLLNKNNYFKNIYKF